MTESFQLPPAIDPDSEIGYRPFSPLALVAILLSLFAFLTIAHPAFVLPGLAALVVGVIAAMRCDHGRRMSGYRLALAAVFLATAGISLGFGHRAGRNFWLCITARDLAKTVFDDVHEDLLEEVLAYATEPLYRQPAGTDMVNYYASTTVSPGMRLPPSGEINVWMELPPFKWMVDDELNGVNEYVGVETIPLKKRNSETFVLRYRYRPATPDLPPFEYEVHFERFPYYKLSSAYWRIWFEGITEKGGKPERATLRPSIQPRKRIRRPADRIPEE